MHPLDGAQLLKLAAMLAVSCHSRQGGGHLPCGWQRAAAGAQVLSPMKKGHAGTRSLNLRLQNLLNPPGAAKPEFVRRASDPPSVFRVGDRVIQVPAASSITTLFPQLKPDSEDRRCQCHCQCQCQFALNQGAVCCPRSGKAGFGCGALCPMQRLHSKSRGTYIGSGTRAWSVLCLPERAYGTMRGWCCSSPSFSSNPW